jgi:hypothetical protein
MPDDFMILTKDEADSLVGVNHRSPHTLLGMHALGGAAGLVVRAFHPRATAIEVVPVHEKNRPRIVLQQARPGLFEGTTNLAGEV